jgi:hypothetical protein
MRRLAAKVSKAIAEEGFFDRGAKKRTDLLNMNTCYRSGVPYILIETCFIDNKSDMKHYKEHLYRIWGEVAEAVCDYYGIKKLASAGEPVKTSKTAKTAKTTKSSTSAKKPAKTAKKSLDAVAKEVIEGKWGNDPTRSRKLKAAGYDPAAVQRRVNALLK